MSATSLWLTVASQNTFFNFIFLCVTTHHEITSFKGETLWLTIGNKLCKTLDHWNFMPDWFYDSLPGCCLVRSLPNARVQVGLTRQEVGGGHGGPTQYSTRRQKYIDRGGIFQQNKNENEHSWSICCGCSWWLPFHSLSSGGNWLVLWNSAILAFASQA